MITNFSITFQAYRFRKTEPAASNARGTSDGAQHAARCAPAENATNFRITLLRFMGHNGSKRCDTHGTRPEGGQGYVALRHPTTEEIRFQFLWSIRLHIG